MEEKPTQSREGVRGDSPCGVKGQRPCGGLGQRPNCSSSDQSQGSQQQRRRQRSVPASNFALPQERPQAALPTPCILSRQMGATTQPLHHTSPLLFPLQTDTQAQKIQENQRHKTAGFFNLQKYSLLQLRQMNPQEHQHVRYKLARCGARFMRRGIPPRQGAVKSGMFCSCHDWLMAVRIARSTASGDVLYRRATVG